MIGCLLLPWFANSLGRKRSIQIITAICIVAGVLQAAAVHVAMLLVGRFIGGVGYFSRCPLAYEC